MYRLPSCAERVPPTWLAPGLDQGPSSLLPRGTSFGRSVQPRPPYFRRGRRTDLSARGRVPPIPEVPGRVLTPDSGDCSALTLSSDRSRHHPCAATCPRPSHQRVMRATNQARRKIHRTLGRDLHWTWRGTRKRQSSIKRRLEGRNHRWRNWSWPSLMDWTFRPSRRSVICLRWPGPRFTSRGRRSGWSEPPPSGDGRRPRPWHSSWVDEGVNITPAGMALCDNDQSAASMPQISRRTG